MRIVIACSNSWFQACLDTLKVDELLKISTKEELNLEVLDDFQPDFVFFPHWSWLVDEEIYRAHRCVLFHTAPLPYGRGGSPIQNLIIEGFQECPLCALEMTGEMDAGPIIASELVSLQGSLREILHRINQIVNKLIVKIVNENPIPVPQIGKPKVFRRLSGADNKIDCDATLEKIFDQIRMLDADGYPNAYLQSGDTRVEFESAQFEGNSIKGSFIISKC